MFKELLESLLNEISRKKGRKMLSSFSYYTPNLTYELTIGVIDGAKQPEGYEDPKAYGFKPALHSNVMVDLDGMGSDFASEMNLRDRFDTGGNDQIVFTKEQVNNENFEELLKKLTKALKSGGLKDYAKEYSLHINVGRFTRQGNFGGQDMGGIMVDFGKVKPYKKEKHKKYDKMDDEEASKLAN